MMAPQTKISVAANVLGTIGTVLWSIQLIPQIWHNYHGKSTEGLPEAMILLWTACAVPFGVYAIVQNFAIPIQLQAQIFCFLSLINWVQILIYTKKRTIKTASLMAIALGLVCGGLEALLILTLREPYSRGVEWPMLLIGIVASILLAAGIVPIYVEIWKRGGRVIGINWAFLSIDWLGGLFSLLALTQQGTFDTIGGVMYILLMVLEGAVFFLHWIWLFRTRKMRNKTKAADDGIEHSSKNHEEQDKTTLTECRLGSVNTSSSVLDKVEV